jgi:hypothetical protein
MDQIKNNQVPVESRFLIVGESGAGKSTFINYLTNYFEGKTHSFNLIFLFMAVLTGTTDVHFQGETNVSIIRQEPSKIRLAIPVKHWETNVAEKYISQSNNENNVEDQTASQTIECREYTYRQKYSFIDTPGLNDTKGSEFDHENVQKIINAVMAKDFLNGVIVVINGTFARLTQNLVNLLAVLKGFLPTEILDNSIVVLTNSDENGLNFDERSLRGIIKYKNRFILQNNYFKTDPNKQNSTERMLRDWQDSNRSIEVMMDKLGIMGRISTAAFKLTDDLAAKLNSHIRKQIANIIQLAQKIDQIELNRVSLANALDTKQSNSIHEKQMQINAIPVGPSFSKTHANSVKTKNALQSTNNNKNKKENRKNGSSNDVEPDKTRQSNEKRQKSDSQECENRDPRRKLDNQMTCIQVSVYDNHAIEQHKHASLEIKAIEKAYQDADKEVTRLRKDIEKNMNETKFAISSLKKICTGFNIIKHVNDMMTDFESKLPQEKGCMHDYYNQLLNIIEN